MTVLQNAPQPTRRAQDAPPLYHFTCDHAAPSIVAVGALVPRAHPLLPRLAPLVWLTSAPDPEPYDIGFPRYPHKCDRMAFRFLVADRSTCEPWWELCDQVPPFVLPATVLYHLETGRRTESWWVSRLPVPVVMA